MAEDKKWFNSDNKKHVKLVDEYIRNGGVGVKAYMAIYPNASYSSSNSNFTKISRTEEFKKFLARRREELGEVSNYNIEKAIANDVMVVNRYNFIMALDFNELGARERESYTWELKHTLTSNHVNSAKERLNKMLGHYELDNQQQGQNEMVVRIVRG